MREKVKFVWKMNSIKKHGKEGSKCQKHSEANIVLLLVFLQVLRCCAPKRRREKVRGAGKGKTMTAPNGLSFPHNRGTGLCPEIIHYISLYQYHGR